MGQHLERLQILNNQYRPDIKLIYSSDEEGNYFDYLCVGPEAVYYDNDEHKIHVIHRSIHNQREMPISFVRNHINLA